jgi:hypothetical protein
MKMNVSTSIRAVAATVAAAGLMLGLGATSAPAANTADEISLSGATALAAASAATPYKGTPTDSTIAAVGGSRTHPYAGGDITPSSGATPGGENSPSGHHPKDLAAQANNPTSSLISVPFQNNFQFGAGPGSDFQYNLQVQPVIPIQLNEDWKLLTRTIIPVVSQAEPFAGSGRHFGLGDIQFTSWLAPTKPKNNLLIGIGPVAQFPTATSTTLGNGKWNLGPTAVVAYTPKNWVIGSLFQNVWSIGGDSDRPAVNNFTWQYFINYQIGDKGWYLTTAPSITVDWKAESGQKWTVPWGGGIGKVVHIGKLPVNLSAQAYVQGPKPDNGADWFFRFQAQLLFPE